MNSLEPTEVATPECTASPKRVVVAHTSNVPPTRIAVVLDGTYLAKPATESDAPAFTHVADRTSRRRSARSNWLCLIERIVGEWAKTLRLALLLVILLIALIVILVVLLGFGQGLLVLGTGAIMKLLLGRVTQPVRAR